LTDALDAVREIRGHPKNARKTHACVFLLQKRTKCDKMFLGGMDDETNTKKRNSYN